VPIPGPFPGLVLNYSYLWYDQRRRGMEEGIKDRPCVVVLAVTRAEDDLVVTVAPITHTPPATLQEAVEIPAATKLRLGLDSGRSWIMVTEINQFHWPGHDLRPAPRAGTGRFDYGVSPPGLFRQVRDGITAWVRTKRLRTTLR
jgi:mRNA-degrading endonuclease toxin of MazEF toxin-antitoxin module